MTSLDHAEKTAQAMALAMPGKARASTTGSRVRWVATEQRDEASEQRHGSDERMKPIKPWIEPVRPGVEQRHLLIESRSIHRVGDALLINPKRIRAPTRMKCLHRLNAYADAE